MTGDEVGRIMDEEESKAIRGDRALLLDWRHGDRGRGCKGDRIDNRNGVCPSIGNIGLDRSGDIAIRTGHAPTGIW